MTDRPSMRRLPIWGAAILALVMTACSEPTATSTTTTAAVAPASTTSTTAQTTTIPIDPAALLDSALAAYADGYRFSSLVIVNGAEVGAIEGVVIGEQAQMDVRSGDATLTYLVTPTQRWVRVEGGEWDLLTEEAPASDPLAEFADPTDLVVTDASGDRVVLTGSYPAVRFGGSEGSITLTLTFQGGSLVEAGYERDGDAATVVTTSFSPLQDTDAIVAPTA